MIKRCAWAEANDLLLAYHDQEWGVPIYDDRLLFELLILEGAQAGLSWLTVLKRRETYRQAFDNFDPKKIAVYDEQKLQALLQDQGIIRNRLKIQATLINAKAFNTIVEETGSFSNYVWGFSSVLENGDPSTATRASEMMSKDMIKKGFKFVGPTICYAYMQAFGMINDHSTDCFRRAQIDAENFEKKSDQSRPI